MAVQRDSEKVWIDNARGFGPCEFVSSVHGCQARILEAIGRPLSYDDLICYGGFAFRVSVHEEMCPSAGHPCCGFPCLHNSNDAIGWQTKLYDSFPWSAPKRDRAGFEAEVCNAIRASIDRGIPVHYGSEEDGLIIGYADGGRRWWCLHPYHKVGGAEAFWNEQVDGFAGGKWPWGISVWVEQKPQEQRIPEAELMNRALTQAVEMWGSEKRVKYFVGDAAYEHWLTWLRDADSGNADPAKGMHGNAWCFDVLTSTRRVAGRWLKQQASQFDERTAGSLRDAAAHFAQIPEIALAGYKSSWDLAMAPKRVAEWTSDLRQRQIERLEAAREHDRAAMASIGAAMESLV